MLTRVVNYFLKGIVFLAPLAFTIYICVRIFTTIDGWLGIAIPGVGFAITVATSRCSASSRKASSRAAF